MRRDIKIKEKKKFQFNLRSEYKKGIKFLIDSKDFIYSSILLFFIFVSIGFFFEDIINTAFNIFLGINLNERIINYIINLLDKTEGMNTTQLIRFIFLNNLQSSFFGMIFGFLLGIFPIISLISNGYLLGFVSSFSVKASGITTLWRILPHGIFELPALFISLGLGLRSGFWFFKKNKEPFSSYILNVLRTFLLIVLPLLFIAAIIESILITFT